MNNFNYRNRRIKMSYTEPYTYDKLDEVKEKVTEVTNVVKENVNKVIERGENLDSILVKTDHLNQNSEKFFKESRALKRKICMRRVKFFACLLLGVAIFILILVVSTKQK